MYISSEFNNFARKFDNEVEVFSESDLPTPVSGIITLADDTLYTFKKSITLNNSLALAEDQSAGLSGAPDRSVIVTYLGSGPLFDFSLIDVDDLIVLNMSFTSGLGTQSVFNVAHTTPGSSLIDIRNTTFFGFGSGGTIDGVVTISFLQTAFFLVSSGLTILNTSQTLAIERTGFFSLVVIPKTMISIGGTQGNVSVLGCVFSNLATGDAALYINPAIVVGTIVISGCQFSSSLGATFFAPGSLDETDIRITAQNNGDAADSRTIGSFLMQDNPTQTIITTAGAIGNELGWEIANGTTVQGSNIQRFTHTSPSTLTYIGLEDFSGIAQISANVFISGGATKDIQVSVFVDDGILDSRVANVVTTVETKTAPTAVPVLAPLSLRTGYIVRVKVRNIIDATNIIVQDIQCMII